MGLQQLNKFEKAQPTIKISRSKFDKSFSHKTTIKSGDLVPIYCEEILPGDTFVIDTNSLIRMNLPAVPVMDDLYCDIYYFWCPNRILTQGEKDWHQIIANENINGPWAPQTEKTLQNTGNTIKLSDFVSDNGEDPAPMAGNYNGSGPMLSSVFNYLLNPIGYDLKDMDADADDSLGAEISKLPFVAYGTIWNEWFRDENTQTPIAPKSTAWLKTLAQTDSCLKVSRFRDYFSTSLPSPQKGGSVALPLGSLAPVVTGEQHDSETFPVSFVVGSTGAFPASNTSLTLKATDGFLTAKASDTPTIDSNINGFVPSNLWADLSQATAATISELRMAFAIQKMLETDARTGSRFREYLLGHFGISIPDNTVQVPEYLGGKRFHIDVNQVVQTAPGASTPLGNLGGISTTFNHSKSVVKSFDEHGYIIGVCCIRPQHSYSQGIPKMWTRNRRFDWYDPKFANLSEMAVFKRELFLVNNGSDADEAHGYDVFGYQEAWAEYRFSQNRVTGAFAPQNGIADLGIWTFADYYENYPSLNKFNQEKFSFVGRALVDTTTYFQFLCDFYFDVKAYRPMPVFSIPGLIDHH